jgi:hypothetical protein
MQDVSSAYKVVYALTPYEKLTGVWMWGTSRFEHVS